VDGIGIVMINAEGKVQRAESALISRNFSRICRNERAALIEVGHKERA
jgi:hypothetical protein